MRAKHTALFFTAGLLLMPTLLWSQFPVGFGGGGGAGAGRPQMDPDQLFDIVAKGQNVIRVDQLDPRSKMMFERFGASMGLTGNEISRDQFKAAMGRVREMAASGQLPGGMNFQGGPGGGSGGDPADRDRRTEQRFQQMDKNQDGMLSIDEMSESLQAERDKWDTNHDGFIDLNEYKGYVNARFEARQGGDNPRRPAADGPNGRFDPQEGDEPERQRPTIVRAGNLPRDFPYAALDTDQDGQIGLYEWKSAGNSISEFLKMDLNNDGFLTVEEYYGWRKQIQDEMAKASGSQSGEFGRGGRGMGGPGGMMAMGMSGGGRGMGGGGFGMGSGGFGMGGGRGGGFGMGGGPGGGRGMDFMAGGGFGGGRGPGRGGPGGGGWGGPGMGGGGFGMGGGGFGMGGAGAGRGFGMGGGNWGGGGMPGPGGWGGGSGMPGNWGSGGMPGPGGDRTFARQPGGDSGGFTPGMTIPGAFTPPGGDGSMQMQLAIPDVMRGPRGDRGPGMGGDRGPGFGGDRGPGGPGGRRGGPGGPGGERGDRPPRKDRGN